MIRNLYRQLLLVSDQQARFASKITRTTFGKNNKFETQNKATSTTSLISNNQNQHSSIRLISNSSKEQQQSLKTTKNTIVKLSNNQQLSTINFKQTLSSNSNLSNHFQSSLFSNHNNFSTTTNTTTTTTNNTTATPDFEYQSKENAEAQMKADMESQRPRTSVTQSELQVLVEMLRDENAMDIVVMDVTSKIHWAQYFIMVEAKSTRHCRALAEKTFESLKQHIRKGQGQVHGQIEGANSLDWMIVDGGSVIVQFFTKEGRQYYDIEKQWALKGIIPEEPEEK